MHADGHHELDEPGRDQQKCARHAQRAGDHRRGVDVQMDLVGEAMTSEVFTAAPGDPVADVVRAMGEQKYGCAVVVDRGHVVGIFTATDACVLLAEVLS